jgi:hypothetical protein
MYNILFCFAIFENSYQKDKEQSKQKYFLGYTGQTNSDRLLYSCPQLPIYHGRIS